MPTYYEILEVSPDATTRDITVSFRRLALIWHPDKNPDNVEAAERKFKLIGEAYETLKDDDLRAKYDEHLKKLAAQQDRKKASQYQSPKHRRRRSDDGEEKEPEWQRHETNTKDVERLLKLAATIIEIMEEHLKEQKRRHDLGCELTIAIKEKRYDDLPGLIAEGAFPDELSDDGLSGLHYAAKENNIRLLEYLIDVAKADVNKKTSEGETPLHFAVRNNNEELCRILVLNYKAGTHYQNNDSKDTPLHYAIKYFCAPNIQTLLINRSTKYTWFFSQYSALDCQDLLGDTPLHLAVKTKQFDVVCRLIYKRAGTNLKNKEGDTAVALMQEIRDELPIDMSAWLDRTLILEKREQDNSNCLVM